MSLRAAGAGTEGKGEERTKGGRPSGRVAKGYRKGKGTRMRMEVWKAKETAVVRGRSERQ